MNKPQFCDLAIAQAIDSPALASDPKSLTKSNKAEPKHGLDLKRLESKSDANPTKIDLFNRARAEIENGDNSLRAAAEALARAKKEFGATQREMALAVGRSAAWVNRLLQWHRSDYKGDSPFGPTTAAERVARAKQHEKALKANTNKASTMIGDAGSEVYEPEASADLDEARFANQSPETTGIPQHLPLAVSPAKALANLKHAIDQWFPKLDAGGRAEATAYLLDKTGASNA